MFGADWPARYPTWLAGARPALEAHAWADGFRGYPWLTYETAPWTPLTRPLAQARIALVTSGGLIRPGQVPFQADNPEGDNGYRVVEGPGPLTQWEIHHGHYNPAGALADYNAVFPLDVLRGLQGTGIGDLAPRHVSFMGYQTNIHRFFQASGGAIVDMFAQDAVDAVLLVPV